MCMMSMIRLKFMKASVMFLLQQSRSEMFIFVLFFFLLSCAEGYLKFCFCGCFRVRKEDLVSIKYMNRYEGVKEKTGNHKNILGPGCLCVTVYLSLFCSAHMHNKFE